MLQPVELHSIQLALLLPQRSSVSLVQFEELQFPGNAVWGAEEGEEGSPSSGIVITGEDLGRLPPAKSEDAVFPKALLWPSASSNCLTDASELDVGAFARGWIVLLLDRDGDGTRDEAGVHQTPPQSEVQWTELLPHHVEFHIVLPHPEAVQNPRTSVHHSPPQSCSQGCLVAPHRAPPVATPSHCDQLQYPGCCVEIEVGKAAGCVLGGSWGVEGLGGSLFFTAAEEGGAPGHHEPPHWEQLDSSELHQRER
mmetsp:Transcript_8189/g.23499  ORF Transcript_8189/g.23499 Transcript_8189/m.23499 type:complete len:253 (+) Transcript_8189:922-1680(+)